MKASIVSCGTTLLLLAALNARAGIIAGPITNPANGHDYYLLTPNSWSESERQAESLGGTLAIITSAAEQEWVFSKFGAYGGTNLNLWLGFHRETPDRFVSMVGENMNYSNWGPGQPDHGGGVENCVQIWSSGSGNDGKGYWNDAVDWTMCNGVVEVPGKSDERALTEKEKALIGKWFHNGDFNQPCWIAEAGNSLFAINNENQDASRVILTAKGFLFSSKWKQHAEIVKDNILWSNGIWWSRTPSDYGNGRTSTANDGAQARSFHVVPN
jgi:hypothetical protein